MLCHVCPCSSLPRWGTNFLKHARLCHQGYLSYALCTAILLFKGPAQTEPASSLSLTDWLEDKRACKNNNLIYIHGTPSYMRVLVYLSTCRPIGLVFPICLLEERERARRGGGERKRRRTVGCHSGKTFVHKHSMPVVWVGRVTIQILCQGKQTGL